MQVDVLEPRCAEALPQVGRRPLRHDLWAYIRQLHADGTSILLTTHYLEEAEALCEQVAFIRAGRIVAEGAPPDLRERFGAPRLEDVYLHLVGR